MTKNSLFFFDLSRQMFDLSWWIFDLSHVIYYKNFDQSGDTSNILKTTANVNTKFNFQNVWANSNIIVLLKLFLTKLDTHFWMSWKNLKQNSNSKHQIRFSKYLIKFKLIMLLKLFLTKQKYEYRNKKNTGNFVTMKMDYSIIIDHEITF